MNEVVQFYTYLQILYDESKIFVYLINNDGTFVLLQSVVFFFFLTIYSVGSTLCSDCLKVCEIGQFIIRILCWPLPIIWSMFNMPNILET
jgi:hypothetical protein